MSYYCEISFKQIPGDEVFAFFQKLKKEATAHTAEIAQYSAFSSPMFKKCPTDVSSGLPQGLREATKEWAQRSVFRYRYFYNKQLQLLGVYSVQEPMRALFDCTIEFQSSTDQDYPYECWNGIKYFEEVANKWKNAEDKEVKEFHEKRYGGTQWDEVCNLDYYRRWNAYCEIWENFEESFDDDDSAVYIALYGLYDFLTLNYFAMCVEEKVKEIFSE